MSNVLAPVSIAASEQALDETIAGQVHSPILEAYANTEIADVEKGVTNFSTFLNVELGHIAIGNKEGVMRLTTPGLELLPIFNTGVLTYVRALEIEADRRKTIVPQIDERDIHTYDNDLLGLERYADLLEPGEIEGSTNEIYKTIEEILAGIETDTNEDIESSTALVLPKTLGRFFAPARELEDARRMAIFDLLETAEAAEPNYVPAVMERINSRKLHLPQSALEVLQGAEHDMKKDTVRFQKYLGAKDIAAFSRDTLIRCFVIPAIVIGGLIRVHAELLDLDKALEQ